MSYRFCADFFARKTEFNSRSHGFCYIVWYTNVCNGLVFLIIIISILFFFIFMIKFFVCVLLFAFHLNYLWWCDWLDLVLRTFSLFEYR